MRSSIIGAIAEESPASGGSAFPSTWAEVLTFSRASASTHWDGTTWTEAASGSALVLTSEVLYVQGARTNLVTDSATIASSFNATITNDASNGPNGDATADRRASTGNNAYARWTLGLTSGVTYAGSVFAINVSGDTDEIFQWSGPGLAVNTAYTSTGSWQRVEVVGTAGSTATVALRAIESGATDNATIDLWGWQIESGATFASQHIETSGGTATRLADDAVIASADVWSELLSGTWQTTITPRRASTESNDTATDVLFDFNAGTGQIWIDSSNRINVDDGSVTPTQTGALTWSADQAITLAFNASTGTVSVSGATTGNGDTVGTAWSMPSGDVQIGNDSSLAAAFFGGIGLPAEVP